MKELAAMLASDSIPVAMILSRLEQQAARYICTRTDVSLNQLGWKVAHLDDVALGRGEIATLPISHLTAHFRRFLSPSNMFVMPLPWAGLAELSPVIEAIRRADAS